MGLFDIFKRETKEETQKKENKINLLGEVKGLIDFILNPLISKLNDKLLNARDSMIITSINKAKMQLEQTKTYLEEAYEYFDKLNVRNALEELKKAEKSTNSKFLGDNIIDYLVNVKVLSKSDRSSINTIRSDVTRLIRDLPKFNL
ncbi:MAG: hypothetical protein AABX55_02875 [Nanoarchaeota archaeon]